jgi:phage terminase small subunit
MPTKPRSHPPSLEVVPPAPLRPRRPEAPSHLSPAMQAWWFEVQESHELDGHHLRLLEAACGAWDRMTEAQAIVNELGMTFVDDRGSPKARPEVMIERDSRTSFARILRELDLDYEVAPTAQRGRPPGIKSNRG